MSLLSDHDPRDPQTLDSARICQQLDGASLTALGRLDVLDSVSSTNSFLLESALVDERVHAVFAERQSAGRGRLGRQWHSPPGGNVYFSIALLMPASALGGASLALGVAVARAIERRTALEIMLKWPNDVYLRACKVGGILVETTPAANATVRMVAGIGLNVADLAPPPPGGIAQPWTSLERVLERAIDRNALAGALLDETLKAMAMFADKGFVALRNDWASRDMVKGHEVTLRAGSAPVLHGVAAGVDAHGALLLNVAGRLERVVAGELSLRLRG